MVYQSLVSIFVKFKAGITYKVSATSPRYEIKVWKAVKFANRGDSNVG
jgi:hypothetical protein